MTLEPLVRTGENDEFPDAALTRLGGYARLKRDIVQAFFAPGDKLVIGGLKTPIQTEVGPLREAISRLVAEHPVNGGTESPLRH
ncbi:GntR family transcriptional regulator [Pseudomonas sp. RIT-PI-q]|uniref:GntR family transcriptional regulator n=1 Tax=Pseudomonas sp. RIT-PI-q TaxID=1690247 RepID=UPI0007C772D1